VPLRPPRVGEMSAPLASQHPVNGVHLRNSLDRLVGKRITSKTDAETEFDRLKVRLKEGGFDAEIPSDLTLGAMLERYQRDYLARKLTATNTQTQINTITRTVLPKGEGGLAFGQWPIADVDAAALWASRTTREIKTVVLSKAGKPTKRTIGGAVGTNRDLQLLRRALNWAKAALPAHVRHSPFEARKGLLARETSRSRRRCSHGRRWMPSWCGAV
jgi:hypothetical protein